MDHETECALLQRCLDLNEKGSTTLGETATSSSPDRYLCPERFAEEKQALFMREPVPYVHASELPGPHTYRRVDSPLGSLLLTRDAGGQAHCFYNVCRHRGAQLVNDASGCSARHSCPYHAWSYSSAGELLQITHQAHCFPELEREKLGLREIPCVERHGLIWVCPAAENAAAAPAMLDERLQGLEADLNWLQLEQLRPFRSVTRVWQANWKLIAEGGLESYHFRFAHKNTIAPFFLNNCFVQHAFGDHFRTVLPTTSIEKLRQMPRLDWHLREHSHVVYALLPMTTFLVQHQHVEWISAQPLAADRTAITIVTLVPEGSADEAHWAKNFEITDATVAEDFAMAESIQRGLTTTANTQLNFGRNEAALHRLNQRIDARCAAASNTFRPAASD